MKTGQGKQVPFHGILAIGGTKNEAVNHYRLLALGKGVAAFIDQKQQASFVTSSDNSLLEMFNPMTGDLDLEKSDALSSSLKFEAKAGDVEATYYVCESGCGSHLVYDSEALVKFCPICTTAVVASSEDPDADTDEDEDTSEEEGEDESSDDEAVAAATCESDDAEPDADADLPEDEGEEDLDAEDEDEDTSESADDEEDLDDDDEDLDDDEDADADDESETPSDEDDEAEGDNATSPLVIASSRKKRPVSRKTVSRVESSDEDDGDEDDLSITTDEDEEDESESEDGDEAAASSYGDALIAFRNKQRGRAVASAIEANYVVCSSAECGTHIISVSGVTECPKCHAPTKEPIVEGVDDAGKEVVAASYDEAVAAFQSAVASTATAATIEAHHVVCSSADCGSHIISHKEVKECPKCHAATKEPEAAAAVEEEAAPAAAPVSAEASAPEPIPVAVTVVAPPAPVDPQELLEVDSLAHVDDAGEDAHKELDLSYSSSISGSSMWTAYFKGRPVATARSADAGKNVDIFDDATFGNAVIASAKHVGVKNILREMGFKGIVQPVQIAKIVEAGVSKEVAIAKSALDVDRKEYAERLMSAMATAAIGVNRGFFADVKNPLKEQLWDTLASAGIKNPEILIHNAFRASSDAYHNMLFAKAAEIIAKPLDVQESLAKAVLGTNYMSVEASSGANALENRLSDFGTATAAAEVVKTVEENEVTAGAQSRIASVVSSLGRRR
jgi:hypothetical protein